MRLSGDLYPTNISGRAAIRVVSVIAALLLLAACGDDTRKLLGLDKKSPDEFKIVSRAPLSLPPDYALRPPAPGTPRPQEPTLNERAMAAISGGDGKKGTGETQVSSLSPQSSAPSMSAGETALLAHAGADHATPDIREILARENSSLAEADTTFLDRLMFWREAEDSSPIVNAPLEAKRLRENAALGKPTSDGDIPTIKRRKKAILEGIF